MSLIIKAFKFQILLMCKIMLAIFRDQIVNLLSNVFVKHRNHWTLLTTKH